MGVSDDRLDILSDQRHAEAIVIARGEGWIRVLQEQGKTLPQVLYPYLNEPGGDKPLAVHQNDVPGGAPACRHLTELVKTDWAVEPQDLPKGVHIPTETFTAYICEAGGKFITVSALNWSNDRRQGEYQRTAFKMVQSLRIMH